MNNKVMTGVTFVAVVCHGGFPMCSGRCRKFLNYMHTGHTQVHAHYYSLLHLQATNKIHKGTVCAKSKAQLVRGRLGMKMDTK